MYYVEDKNQLRIEEFAMLFEGRLDPDNRWFKLAGIMPWDHIEEIYLRTMSIEKGRRAYPSRIAIGAIFIKEYENYTDERCVTAIQEYPICSTFLGSMYFSRNHCLIHP